MSMSAASINRLTCIGSGHKPPNFHRWGPGVRDVYALHYIARGKGVLETNNQRYPLQAGDSFVIFPEKEVYYYPDLQDPWEYVWIEFKGEEALRLLSMTLFAPASPVVAESPADLSPLFYMLEHAPSRPDYEAQRAEGHLRLLLSYYLEYYPQEAPGAPANYVERAKEYIGQHYWRKDLSVSDVADAVNIERSYLFRMFKQATGMSVSAYLISFRIRRACELLESSGLSVKSVACSVGYKDPLYFSSAFKRATSHTPSEYMTLHRKIGALPE